MKWSEEDILFLKNNYSTMCKKELVEKLGRSWHTIVCKAASFNLRRLGHLNAPRNEYWYWTADEEKILSDMWCKSSKSEIITKLPLRSWRTIMVKAHRMKLNGRRASHFSPAILPELTDAERGYIAGLVDGEGNITISYRDGKTDPGVRVNITNTDYSLMEWIRSKLMCGYIYTRKNNNNKCKTVHTFVVYKRAELYTLLKMIEPYCVIKKNRVILLLEWLELNMMRNNMPVIRDKKGMIRGTRSQLTKREIEIKNELTKLNMRGPK